MHTEIITDRTIIWRIDFRYENMEKRVPQWGAWRRTAGSELPLRWKLGQDHLLELKVYIFLSVSVSVSVCLSACVDFCCAFMWSQFNGEHAGAAMRRRQRRLRQWLRHERLNVAMVLAESQHHAAPRGQSMARAGEGGGYEMKFTAEFQVNPPPRSPARSTSSSTTLTSGRRSESRGASWSTLSLLCPLSSSSTCLCRRW